MVAPAELIGLLEEIRRIPPDQISSFDHPAFVALRMWVQCAYPGAGSDDGLNFALSAALLRLGLSGGSPADRTPPPSAATAAAQLLAGFAATRAWRTHLCPLDVADEVPDISFGPNAVRALTFEDLQDLFAPLGHYAASLDRRLAEFRWLIVREEVTFEYELGRRAFPFLYMDLSKDFAGIDPHARKFPPAVERALFVLLLAAWEDQVTHADINWRAFQIPWVYTIDEDLVVRPAPLPSADSLSWMPEVYRGDDGERIEFERPLVHGWSADPIDGVNTVLNAARWQEAELALASDLFSTPIVHFLVAAFLAIGIDEFIAHLTVVEAALGLRADQARERTLGARIQSLLGDAGAAATYGRLFNLRSEYVHGRPMSEISGVDRNDARRLARRVADALVQRAQAPVSDRASFLLTLAPSKPPKSIP